MALPASADACSSFTCQALSEMHWQCRTEDNRFLGLVMAKQTLGEHWHCLFRGDTAGARCMQPPYMLAGMRLEDDFSRDALCVL